MSKHTLSPPYSSATTPSLSLTPNPPLHSPHTPSLSFHTQPATSPPPVSTHSTPTSDAKTRLPASLVTSLPYKRRGLYGTRRGGRRRRIRRGRSLHGGG